jgi:hypothetical protein
LENDWKALEIAIQTEKPLQWNKPNPQS